MPKLIGQIMVENQMVTPQKLEIALGEQQRTNELIGAVLVRMGVVTHKELARALAIQAEVPFIPLNKTPINPEAFGLISDETARKLMVVPFAFGKNTLQVAMENPNNIHALDRLRRETGKKIEIFGADLCAIQKAIEMYTGSGGSIDEEIDCNIQAAVKGSFTDGGSMTPVVRLVDLFISRGVQDHATDIHLTPEEKAFRVSYRIDGVLHSGIVMPKHLHMPIVNRVKIASGMNIAEQRLPQEGSMAYDLTGRSIDIRTSTSPCKYGENVVLRLLDKSSVLLDLKYLGLAEQDRCVVEKLATRPHGIILNSGPTGSGKTTTLYAMLQSVNSLERNILTIEDPIEYTLPFIKQTQVNEVTGLGFSEAIKHFFRQDPDVILVGEIRDLETARIAMQAGMTGHLVLSTIHTNDAVSTIPRLLDLGVESYLVSSVLRAVISQRLVRRICRNCKEEYGVNLEELAGYGLGEWGLEHKKLMTGKGCDFCENLGYHGRIGIFEILAISDGLSQLISQKSPANLLLAEAKKEGMVTMRQDGLMKVVKGITTLEEVLKAT
ncbi:MAG: GspE/PulE family protein [Desulfobulbales bacterium]|nr:GspE/PulE family protein [Desulfobulbales bacterium]